FMIATVIALLVNFPKMKDQQEELASHASAIISVVAMVMAAGVLTGIMSGTGMVDAMAAWLVDVIPESMGPFMAVITGLLSIPMTFFMSNDAFYFGILPVLSETAAHFGISAADMARASITGQPVHMQSPLVPAILLLVSLSGVELGDHHKKVLWRARLVVLVMLAVGVADGVIGNGCSDRHDRSPLAPPPPRRRPRPGGGRIPRPRWGGRSASSASADRTGMTDLDSAPHRRFPAPSLRVAASPGIDEAEATVVLALRPDASPAVCQEAIAAARRENAGLRAIVFDTD